MSCTCTTCADCRGSGIVWFSFSGNYLGSSRCDDLDDFESCHMCGGDGVVDICEECQRNMEEEAEHEWEEERQRAKNEGY